MKEKSFKRFWIIVFSLLALAAIALYVYAYVVPQISGALTKTSTAYFGSLRVQDDVKAIIVRDEEVIYSEHGGELSCYVQELDKCRKDTKVLDVYSTGKSTHPSYCPQTGFVSYVIDGYEAVFTPEELPYMTPSRADGYLETCEPGGQDHPPQTVAFGDPLYKLIKNDTWYLMYTVDAESAENYKEGQNVKIIFDDAEIQGTVYDVLGAYSKKTIVVSTKRYYVNFANRRICDVSVVTSEQEGLLIPSESVSEEDGVQGVFVRDIYGDYKFVRVKILAVGESETLIAKDSFTETDSEGNQVNVSTVKIYDEVLRNP